MTDIEIAKAHKLMPITEIAKGYADAEELELYGKYKAKFSGVKERKADGKLILVTAINPTSAGEGKTTVSIGLADGIKLIGKKVALALREPSLGPVFGIKGGAAGGGYSQVVPMEDINLHFTGDLHAITSCNNLLSALIDNHIHQGNELNINPKTIAHRRCLDMNDRALREVMVGLGGAVNGVIRNDSFDITAASEVMAILCLATDMENLKLRLGNIIVGYNYSKQPVYSRDLKAEDAMTILLKDAIKPNLVQSLGGVPAFIHGGPFANIAHGCNSILATKAAMSVSDYVVTEAGFGADLGAQKFLDVKCRIAGLSPDCVVIVATVRALKMHGGLAKSELNSENVQAVIGGCANLKKHVENIKNVYGLNAVVAINQFLSDTESEIDAVKAECEKLGVKAILANVWGKGGEGARELASEVVKVADGNMKTLKFSYDLKETIENKIESIATKIYGAEGVNLSSAAKKDIELIKASGYNDLPVIIAKTQYSLSDNSELIGAPVGFDLNVKNVMLKAGSGFIVAVCGDMMLMPGLSKVPSAVKMKIDAGSGDIDGLF